MAGRILVGTSSWADPGFVKDWYPPGMPAEERLPWYAQRFEAVELNSSFYAVPERNTVHAGSRSRRTGSPSTSSSTGCCRATRRRSTRCRPTCATAAETDAARPRAARRPSWSRPWPAAFEETAPLAEAGKLGAYLLQLTPGVRARPHRLDELEALVEAFAPHRLAIELRNRGWVRRASGARRRSAGSPTAAWRSSCVDAPPGDHPDHAGGLDAVTRDDLAYLRLHGRNTDGYLRQDRGGALRLAATATRSSRRSRAARAALAEQAGEVHVFFNNNRDDDAPTAARRFRALLGQAPPAPDDEQLTL